MSMWYIQSVPFYSSTWIADGSNSLSTNRYSYCSLFHWYLQKHGGIRSTPSWQLITQRFFFRYIIGFSKACWCSFGTYWLPDLWPTRFNERWLRTAWKLSQIWSSLRKSFDRGLLSNLLQMSNVHDVFCPTFSRKYTLVNCYYFKHVKSWVSTY